MCAPRMLVYNPPLTMSTKTTTRSIAKSVMVAACVWLVAAILTVDAGTIILKTPPRPLVLDRQHPPIPPGTDLGLYNEGFVEGDIVPRPTIKNAVIDQSMVWPMGTIVYKTDDDIGCPDSPQCEILMKAMDHYHQKSCVRFKEWTGEKDYVTIFFNPDNGACWSPVGRTGGEQLLSLGQRCWYLGIVVHELGHAVGFWHEMNRPDRDSYIRIFWNNIISGFESAFVMHGPGSVDTLQEDFDYRSIMMYDEYAFSKDGVSPTIQAKQQGVTIGPIWRKPGLSASDLRRIQKLYKCQGIKPKRGFPYDVHCNFNRDTCGFKNGGKAIWNWRNSTQPENYVYSTCEAAGTTPGYFISTNFHPSQDTKRGCLRFWYLLRSEQDLALQVSQIHLRSVTQLSYDSEDVRELWETQESYGKWTHAEISIDTSRPFKIVFMSAFSDMCRRGVIALDDVQVMYRPCQSSPGVPAEMSTEPRGPSSTNAPSSSPPSTTSEEPNKSPSTPAPDALPLPPRPAVTQPRPPRLASPDRPDISHQPQQPPVFPYEDSLETGDNDLESV